MADHNLMRDPFYAPILASIEMVIVKHDEGAQADGLRFTDSQVNSVLHKVARFMDGKEPKAKEPSSEKERRQQALYAELLALRGTMNVTHNDTKESQPLGKVHYGNGVKAVQESLKRRKGLTGDRDFLEYAIDFVAQLKARSAAEGAEESSDDDETGKDKD